MRSSKNVMYEVFIIGVSSVHTIVPLLYLISIFYYCSGGRMVSVRLSRKTILIFNFDLQQRKTYIWTKISCTNVSKATNTHKNTHTRKPVNEQCVTEHTNNLRYLQDACYFWWTLIGSDTKVKVWSRKNILTVALNIQFFVVFLTSQFFSQKNLNAGCFVCKWKFFFLCFNADFRSQWECFIP